MTGSYSLVLLGILVSLMFISAQLLRIANALEANGEEDASGGKDETR